MIEVIAASPVQGTFASGTTPSSATITFSEPGIARLADLIVGVQTNDVDLGGTDISEADFSKAVRIQAITLNGSTLFIRGRNTASPPNAFCANRRANFVALPDVRVASGDTLVVTAIFVRTNVGTANLSAMVPFQPDRFRGMRDAGVMGVQGELWAGSPTTALTADGTNATITLTFDTPGLIDLSRLVAHATATVGEDVAADDFDAASANDVPLSFLQLILRSDYNIVVGQGTPSAPSPFGYMRSKNFVKLGVHRVVPGDTLVATVEANTTTRLDGQCSMGVPLLPDDGFGGIQAGGGACNPCGR